MEDELYEECFWEEAYLDAERQARENYEYSQILKQKEAKIEVKRELTPEKQYDKVRTESI